MYSEPGEPKDGYSASRRFMLVKSLWLRTKLLNSLVFIRRETSRKRGCGLGKRYCCFGAK